MWQRKLDPKTKDAKRPKRIPGLLNPVVPILCGLVSAALGFLIDIIAGNKFVQRPLSVGDAVHKLPQFFIGGIVAGYCAQFLTKMGPRTMICNKCHQVKWYDKKPDCCCGGVFEPFENWQWVDDGDGDAPKSNDD